MPVTKNASMEQHKSSQEGLGIGSIITTPQERDAIHVAIVPVVARDKVFPSQHVGLVDGQATALLSDRIGIVDPFLGTPVQPGETFWLFLYPGSITSLRHVWTHPAMDGSQDVTKGQSESEEWLKDFCRRSDGPDYTDIMSALKNGGTCESSNGYYSIRIDDEYIHVNGSDAHGEIPPEFWDHVETVLGRKVQDRPTYFSCSC